MPHMFTKTNNPRLRKNRKSKLLAVVRGSKRAGAPSQEDLDAVEYLMDPRQLACWQAYADPKSKTFCNAYRSALNAGYSEAMSRTMTGRTWFKDRLRRLKMLSKAEKVFDRTLDMNTVDNQGKEQADLLRIQTDVAKHISKTLGKDEGYSERSEVTGKNGNPIVFMPSELFEKYNLGTEEEINN